MAFVVNSNELSRIGIAREATFGTAIAQDQGFTELFVPKGVRVDPNVKKSDLDLNRASRVQHSADIFNDNFTGPVLVNIPELICSIDIAAMLIYGVTQSQVSQGLVGTAYSKVYKMHASQPDFTANAGFFFTLAWRGPVSGKHIQVASCIVKKLTIDFDKTGTGDAVLVKFKNVEILGKKMTQSKTYSGTWTAQGSTRFNAYAFTYTDITGSNTALPWQKCSITLDNGAEVLDRDSDGSLKTYFLNPPKPGIVVVEVSHFYNADTAGTIDMLSRMAAGTVVNSKISTGSADTTGFFDISWQGVSDGNPQGDDGRKMIVPVKWVCGNTSTNADAVIITLADNISQTA